MSRKTRRQQRKTSVSRPSTVTSSTISSVTSASRSSEFNPDYSYVKQDLRRIGILAGSFISVLVILSFFLR
jgi:hypothetical protein